jgi:hypothetical protein
MLVDRCQFLSNEQPLRAQDRTSICFNVNANDVKVRDNRAVKFGTFAIMAGSGHLIIGNHWFQGDEEPNGLRMAGLVLTDTNVKTTITGNYIDNNVIEWANEHDAFPEFNNEYSFGGLTITGNIFTTIRVAPWFRWLVIRPHGPGHYIHGLAITGNAFRPLDGAIDRIEGVDTTFAGLDMSKARNIVVEGNTFNGVTQTIANPVVLEASRATPEKVWTVGSGGYLPFGGQARIVTSVMFEGRIESDSGTAIYAPPYYNGSQGPDGASITLTWTVPVKGKVRVTARMDNPN